MTYRIRLSLLLAALTTVPSFVSAQRTGAGITAADLRTRLRLISDDSMGGRATGSWGDFQTTEYVAAEFRRLGLIPGGENGTWFQVIPFFRLRAAAGSQIVANGATLRLGPDFIVSQNRAIPRPIEGRETVFGGTVDDSSTWISADAARDRLVIMATPPGVAGLSAAGQMLGRTQRFADAAALVFPVRNAFAPENAAAQVAGRVMTDTTRSGSAPGRISVTVAAAEHLLGRPLAGAEPGTLGGVVHGQATLSFAALPYAARNVVGILRGSDGTLAGTMVSMTAHHDHVGFDNSPVDHDSLHTLNKIVRPQGADSPMREPTAAEWDVIHHSLDSIRRIRPPRPDSIRNGADDDGSGTAVLLEAAEYFASQAHPRRSVLFVNHAAEEEGLLGSRWFADHPTVVRDSIVSEFDMDEVARGNAGEVPGGSPAYLEIVGMRRLSPEYGDLIDAVNARQPLPFKFNLIYDTPGHPLQYYCRADHYSYARYDIPSVAISRGEHSDYHQVTDEEQYADYDAMARVGKFAADVVGTVANLDHRPKVDFAKHDPAARCVQ